MRHVARLDWDSGFFDFSIGQVLDGVDAAGIEAAVQEADNSGFRCTYLLANVDDHEMLESAQVHGFVVRDIRVDMERLVEGHRTSGLGLRHGLPGDSQVLRGIVDSSFRGTRFSIDPGFPSERCADLYMEWVNMGLRGDADWTAIVTDDLSGFVILSIERRLGIGTIVLIGVSPSHVGKGVGSALMSGAGGYFVDNSLTIARVATQGHNIAAQNLYQSFGYRPVSMKLWLHRWKHVVDGIDNTSN